MVVCNPKYFSSKKKVVSTPPLPSWLTGVSGGQRHPEGVQQTERAPGEVGGLAEKEAEQGHGDTQGG